MNDAHAEELTFEAALEELEKVVNELERGDLALEQALEAFERGMKLKQICAQKLAAAERRVELVTSKEPGGTERQNFEVEPES